MRAYTPPTPPGTVWRSSVLGHIQESEAASRELLYLKVGAFGIAVLANALQERLEPSLEKKPSFEPARRRRSQGAQALADED